MRSRKPKKQQRALPGDESVEKRKGEEEKMLTDGGRRRLCRLDKLADSSSAPRSLPIRRLQRSDAADDRRVDVQQPPPSSSSCRPAHVISIPVLTKICTLTAPCTGAFSEMYALAHAAAPQAAPRGWKHAQDGRQMASTCARKKAHARQRW